MLNGMFSTHGGAMSHLIRFGLFSLMLFSFPLLANYHIQRVVTLVEGQKLTHHVLNDRGQLMLLLSHPGSTPWKEEYTSLFFSPDKGSLQVNQVQLSALNNLGMAVGTHLHGQPQAILYDGKEREQHKVSRTVSSLADINNRGVSVGWTLTSERVQTEESTFAKTHLFVHKVGQTEVKDLGNLPGLFHRISPAFLNDRGEVVGTVDHVNGDRYLFFYTPSEGLQNLGSIGSLGEVVAFNEKGEAIGHRADFNSETGLWIEEPFFFSKHHASPFLRTLPSLQGKVIGLNDQGLIIGQSESPTGAVQSWITHLSSPEKKALYRPPSLPSSGTDQTLALSINSSGKVAGGVSQELAEELTSTVSPYFAWVSLWMPTLWDGESGAATSLNAHLKEEEKIRGMAVGINKKGQMLILGFQRGESQLSLFLLTPQ